MENSQHLATESFSYSWLTDKKLPNSHEREQNLSFDFSFESSQTTPAHADEIFSGGHIMPANPDREKKPARFYSKSAPQSPAFSYFSRRQSAAAVGGGGDRISPAGRWVKSSKKLLDSFFSALKPLIGQSSKSNNRVDDFERVQIEAHPRRSSVKPGSGERTGFIYGLKRARSLNRSVNWSSPQASIRPLYNSCSSWSCDVENSIHEAILYCKKSIEK
ncbi:elongation factor 1-alpha [Striga asiatica]|uniref:Elongation factor 1-alpha n=1 Tax=Striga asiatica TaxID=4170 RepID=A0A5A7QJI8_STRAF|nr:elongation factor 1-alpha [Striga asiatica]